jgi:hypothetical protein
MRRTFAVTACFAFASASHACYWDYDTLAEEAKGRSLDDVSIIVGRFERNPPLYYEVRLERVSKQIPKEPRNFNLYDDAGVAADRLGKHDEALKWMQKKWSVLEPAWKAAPEDRKADVYRFHANIGTFWAHKWASSKERSKPWLVNARDHLKSAVEINPDAHFGREKFQLMAIEWLLAGGKDEHGNLVDLAEYLRDFDTWKEDYQEDKREGLAGLVRLGNGWKSVDLVYAYGESLSYGNRGESYRESLRYLADLRVRELLSGGASSIFPEGFYEKILTDSLAMIFDTEAAHVEGEYEKLRENADKWHEHRTEFMLAQLKAGKHPDTHPDFWTGYVEVPRYEIEARKLSLNERFHRGERLAEIIVFTILGSIPVVGIVSLVLLVRWVKGLRARTA